MASQTLPQLTQEHFMRGRDAAKGLYGDNLFDGVSMAFENCITEAEGFTVVLKLHGQAAQAYILVAERNGGTQSFRAIVASSGNILQPSIEACVPYFKAEHLPGALWQACGDKKQRQGRMYRLLMAVLRCALHEAGFPVGRIGATFVVEEAG